MHVLHRSGREIVSELQSSRWTEVSEVLYFSWLPKRNVFIYLFNYLLVEKYLLSMFGAVINIT